MSSFLCFVCHSTVNADNNEDTRDKYREVIGMNLCPDSHLCFICCHFLNKMWLFKSICLKRSLEYPVLFSEKGTINLQRSDTQVGILCPEDICLQHRNSKYHFYNNNENSPSEFEENRYVQLHEDMHFGLLPNNVEVQTDDIFVHFNDNLLKSDADVHFNNDEFLVSISKETNENARRDIDEFIFGNDSIESPLENINKIELANLDEMTEVNITLTDLNVRNFEKLQENNEKSYLVEKTYFRNYFVGKSQECNVRNNNFIDKSHEMVKNDEHIERSDEYCSRNNNFVDKTDVANNEVPINNIDKSPELVRNIVFVEKPQEYIVGNNDFIETTIEESDLVENQEVNDDNVTKDTTDNANYNISDISDQDDQFSNSPTEGVSVEINEETEKKIRKKKEKVKKFKNIYNQITLTREEQKLELEANRKSKEYTEAVFKCYSCGTGFMFKDSYQAHMMRHEESNGEHRCLICTLRFANPAVLRSHLANHAVRYQCRRCDQTIRRRHKSTHPCQRAKQTPVPCHLCGSVFPSPSHLQQHVKRVHNKTSRRSYLCNVCGKSYSNQAAVRTHMIKHINKKFSCERCSSTFSSPYTLNQHKKKHESHTTELHYCVTCNIGYKTRKSLLAHQRNALAHMEKVYKCPVCDKTCPTLRALHNHTTAVHARTRDLFCAMCPARYSTRKGLVRHMRCHSNAGPRQLPLCHACGQTFKSSSILKRHLRNVCEKDKLEEELSSYYEQ